jgi:hypothetical protein
MASVSGFDVACPIASIAIKVVVIVALLWANDDSISADILADGALIQYICAAPSDFDRAIGGTSVAIDLISIIALLRRSRDCISAYAAAFGWASCTIESRFDVARRGASIAIEVIPIVALLGGNNNSISTRRRKARRFDCARFGSGDVRAIPSSLDGAIG